MTNPNYDVFTAFKIVFMLANSVYPNEMPLYLGLHCLLKHLFYLYPE